MVTLKELKVLKSLIPKVDYVFGSNRVSRT